jgi:hypothetical protein
MSFPTHFTTDFTTVFRNAIRRLLSLPPLPRRHRLRGAHKPFFATRVSFSECEPSQVVRADKAYPREVVPSKW